jgi:hypothetical protein
MKHNITYWNYFVMYQREWFYSAADVHFDTNWSRGLECCVQVFKKVQFESPSIYSCGVSHLILIEQLFSTLPVTLNFK